jgi:hypothetical protein
MVQWAPFEIQATGTWCVQLLIYCCHQVNSLPAMSQSNFDDHYQALLANSKAIPPTELDNGRDNSMGATFGAPIALNWFYPWNQPYQPLVQGTMCPTKMMLGDVQYTTGFGMGPPNYPHQDFDPMVHFALHPS